MLSHRSGLAVAAVTCILFIVPSLAQATDFCVNDDPCVQGGGTMLGTFEDALQAAEAGQSADRIFLGTGTYTAPTTAGYAAPMYPVEVIGQGNDRTALTGPANSTPVLTLGNPGSAVSNLLIVSPDAPDKKQKIALDMTGGTAKGLAITGAMGATPYLTGAKLGGTDFEDSTVTVTGDFQTAIDAGTDTRIERVAIDSGNGITVSGADVQIDRARIRAGTTGIFAKRLNTLITDSFVRVTGTGSAVLIGDGAGSTVTATLRNSTLVGPDGKGADGIYAFSAAGHNVTAIVDSTVVRGFKTSVARSSNGGITNIGMLYSDWDYLSADVGNGFGSLIIGPGNRTVDPLFTGALDFHPLAGSPLIDAGNPGTFSDTVDLDGNPRVVGGRRDIGAFESQPAAPAPLPQGSSDPAQGAGTPAPSGGTQPPPATVRDLLAPAISGLRITPARFKLSRGASLAFKLSEPATVTVAVKRRAAHGSRLQQVATLRRAGKAGAGRIAIRRRFAGAKLRTGRYVAIVTATDAAGNRSRASRLNFNVIGG